MAKFKSKWIDLSDSFIFSGNIESPTPTTDSQVANKQYVDGKFNSIGQFKATELQYTDLTNKVIQITDEVDTSSLDLRDDIVVIPIGGTVLDYGVDYTIRNIGSVSYICISPDTTPPTGSFDGGDPSNPSVGITELLENDLVKIMYKTSSGSGGSEDILSNLQSEIDNLNNSLPVYPPTCTTFDNTFQNTDSIIEGYFEQIQTTRTQISTYKTQLESNTLSPMDRTTLEGELNTLLVTLNQNIDHITTQINDQTATSQNIQGCNNFPITVGSTSQRPNTPLIGANYFDTDLSIPIWYSGDLFSWVNYNGNVPETDMPPIMSYKWAQSIVKNVEMAINGYFLDQSSMPSRFTDLTLDDSSDAIEYFIFKASTSSPNRRLIYQDFMTYKNSAFGRWVLDIDSSSTISNSFMEETAFQTYLSSFPS